MDERLKNWLEAELRDYEIVFKGFNRRLMKKVPLWAALCVAGMVALGFGVGYDWTYVVRVHLPIGVGLAVFVWLCFWVQARSVSMKKVRASFEKALGELGGSDQDGFVRQASMFGKTDFLNSVTDKYPARLLVGPEYWLYFRDLGCQVFRVADMQRIWAKEETTRVGYSIGNTKVRQNLGIAVSMMVEYRDGTAWAAKSPTAKVYLENGKQLDEAWTLVEKYCPKAKDLFDK